MKNTNTNTNTNAAKLENIVSMIADERNAAAKNDSKNELTAAIYAAIGAKNDELKTAAAAAAERAAELKTAAIAAITNAAAAAKTAAAAAAIYAAAARHNVNAAAIFGNISDNIDNDERAAAGRCDMFGEYAAFIDDLTAAESNERDNAAERAAELKTAADNAAAERAAIVKKHDELTAAANAANAGAIADALTAAANAAAAELAQFDERAAANAAAAERAALAAAIADLFGGQHTPKTERAAAKTERAAAVDSSKYSYVDAIIDALATTDEWLTAGGIADIIENMGKLPQTSTNPRWAGALSNALKSAADSGKIERRNNGKYNEYHKLTA